MSIRTIASAVTTGVIIAFLAAGTAAAQPRALAPAQLRHAAGAAIAQTGERPVDVAGDEGGKPESDAGGKGKGKGQAGTPGEADR
ncbi:hypothetical protein [Nocardia fluminea]|uniref:Uncharacterized protein n=1 Tax=Nocardia fluminea TaxID=134984 RepID=A0A2N3WX73_9NOCA|nr:hypothetical protein [Nocardia fluminea]PKV98492.1 hypothetical protein ATK86_0512 [Nocardia fluminea]